MLIQRLDHLVLTVADIETSVDFYTRVLGMAAVTFKGGRRALSFGQSKINLHQAGSEFEPKAQRPTREVLICASSSTTPSTACWRNWPTRR